MPSRNFVAVALDPHRLLRREDVEDAWYGTYNADDWTHIIAFANAAVQIAASLAADRSSSTPPPRGRRLPLGGARNSAFEQRAFDTAYTILEGSGLRYQSAQIDGLATILAAYAQHEIELAKVADPAVPAEPPRRTAPIHVTRRLETTRWRAGILPPGAPER